MSRILVIEESLDSFVYILRCSDGSLYTGWSINVEDRVKVHNSGKGAKYTRSRLPVTLVFKKSFSTRREAMFEECKIKLLTRKEKEKLIESNENQLITEKV